MEDHKKYLRPEVVSRLNNIGLIARLVVEGFITGLHKSPYHGFSIEFSQHRQYMPGDELKHIDWKIFGRTDKYFVKQYEDETNLRTTIILDSSASMRYKSGGEISKYEYATYLAASLAFLMMKQKDAVGLAVYNTEIQAYLPAKAKTSYIQQLIKAIGDSAPSDKTGSAMALNALSERISRRGLIIILSDFFDSVEDILTALKRFRHNNHEILTFQICDPRERDFNFATDAVFKDMETAEELTTQPLQIKYAYKQAMQEFTEQLQTECRSRNIDFVPIDTAQGFDVALAQYLIRRQKIKG